MKKTLLLTLTILLSNLSIGQEIPQLKLTPNGVEPIVVEVDNLSASIIYEKTQNWVQETYKNPDKVLKATIANEKLIIDGLAQNSWCTKTLGMNSCVDMTYRLEISFKENKYRLEYLIEDFFETDGRKLTFNYKAFFKKNGELRKMNIEKVKDINKTMNSLSLNLYNYITGKTSENDEW